MIMTCPKCRGSGKVYPDDVETTTGVSWSTCPSCGGKGYVTDVPGPTRHIDSEVYLGHKTTLKCPHCGQEINIHITVRE